MDLLALEGILKIANLLLAVIAGGVALTLFHKAWKGNEHKAWRFLIFALIFFAIQEILGALRAFGVYESPFLTHINVSVILCLLIGAVVLEIDVKKRGVKNG